MSILDKLRKAKQPKEEAPKEEVKEEAKKEAISEKELTETLKGFLYSDDLVSEYINTFRKLYEVPEFRDVMELIQAKEEELNSINQASEEYFKEQAPDNQSSEKAEETDDNEDYLMSILNERYGE
ncbi:MAG: hypothetical protein ACQEXI_01060 [Pseudomonadota bacterium]